MKSAKQARPLRDPASRHVYRPGLWWPAAAATRKVMAEGAIESETGASLWHGRRCRMVAQPE